MYLFAKKFGWADRFFRNIKVNGDEPYIEDVTREFNKGMWTIGYTGQSPERLKAHMKNQHVFDKTTLQAVGGELDGDYYGLPWPCWGNPEMKHPGTLFYMILQSLWQKVACALELDLVYLIKVKTY